MWEALWQSNKKEETSFSRKTSSQNSNAAPACNARTDNNYGKSERMKKGTKEKKEK